LLRLACELWIHAAMRKPILLCTLSLSALACAEQSVPQRSSVDQAQGAVDAAASDSDSTSDEVNSDTDSISDPELDVTTFVPGVASGAGEIFDCPVGYGPQTFVVPGEQAPEDAYLYIVSWADRAFTQGALAQFARVGGSTIYSGDSSWQVCATGVEFDIDTTTGPDQATVNQYLQACNVGAEGATFSKGWVDTAGAYTQGARGKLALGEANDDASGNFPVVCQEDDAGVPGIEAQARWMWFDPEDGSSPFMGNENNRTQTFLIFRLPALILL
jgi:hypothetical protein